MPAMWFKPRGYKHLDAQVRQRFATSGTSPARVARHSWLPLIHYVKTVRRYDAAAGKTIPKTRDIMYASHRDACILSKYAHVLTAALEAVYKEEAIGSSVIAYRKLGKSNYHFAAEARAFAESHAPCVALCFDISGFFDHLDHRILKDRLKKLLNVSELPADWYRVFHHVTRYSKIARDDLASHPVFGPRLRQRSPNPIAAIQEVKSAGVPITVNPNRFGIPQGTPISSTFSNLYLIELDRVMTAAAASYDALYRRYSDDILIICAEGSEPALIEALEEEINTHKLQLKSSKFDRKTFEAGGEEAFQYLGFNLSPKAAVIRSGSISRRWRRLKHNVAKVQAAASQSASGQVYTKTLRKRFSPVGARNSSSYARRAADAVGDCRIRRQVRRLEREADRLIRALKSGFPIVP